MRSYFGIGMAGVAIAFVTARVIAPSLKILLDIFRYIGSDTYREKIQLHLDSIIHGLSVDAGAGKQVVILSHSLGTVIAPQLFLSSEAWAEDARITLITLGSPIQRLFMRFFPGSSSRRRSRRQRARSRSRSISGGSTATVPLTRWEPRSASTA